MAILQENCTTNRCLIVLVLKLILMILGLVVYMAYKESNDEKNGFKDSNTKQRIMSKYGNFFRTQREQEQLENKLRKDDSTMVPSLKNATDPKLFNVCRSSTDSSTFLQEELNNRPSRRKKRSPAHNRYIEGPKHHGCCTSQRKFISPSTAISDGNGRTLTLVQFDDKERQYFLSQDCSHNIPCNAHCGCRQQVGLYLAVVENPDYDPSSDDSSKQVIRTIRIPGSCKCLNNYPPPNMWDSSFG